MSYLHAKGIVHKDLKSGNIFLEGGKALVSDYGLFNITRLCYADQYARPAPPCPLSTRTRTRTLQSTVHVL